MTAVIGQCRQRLHCLQHSQVIPGQIISSLLLLLLLQGHMVPMDQPAASLDMINRFMYNKDLADEDDVVTGSQQQQKKPAVKHAAGVRQSLQLPTAEGVDVAVV